MSEKEKKEYERIIKTLQEIKKDLEILNNKLDKEKK